MMKFKFVFPFLCLFSVMMMAQAPETEVVVTKNITPSQFTAICNKSLGEVEEFLTLNNWHFYQATDEKEDKYGNARFAYDRPNLKPGDSAEYLFAYYYSDVENARALELTFNDTNMVQKFNEELTAQKYSLSSSTIKKGRLVKVFKKGSQIVELTIPASFDVDQGYKYLFAKKSSYKKIRGN